MASKWVDYLGETLAYLMHQNEGPNMIRASWIVIAKFSISFGIKYTNSPHKMITMARLQILIYNIILKIKEREEGQGRKEEEGLLEFLT